jgi:hypothetical protein
MGLKSSSGWVNKLKQNSDEIRELEWWSNYHRESAKWLAIRIQQVLVEGKEDITPILLGSLPFFLEEYAQPESYHFVQLKSEGGVDDEREEE